jgi:Short C-terminal domain
VDYGKVLNVTTGSGYERSSANKTVRLRVEPPGGAPYEATLKLGRDDADVPPVAGTRMDVLVDPTDPQRVATCPDPSYTLPGGQTWQPNTGIAGAIADATRRGDAKELMRLSTELQKQSAAAKEAGEAATPDPGTSTDPLDRLEKLGKLHASGVLNDEEFAAEKARILGDAT